MKLRYARWQGAVAAAAVIAFIAATGWRYPAMAAGIGIGVVLVLKGATALIRRFGNSS